MSKDDAGGKNAKDTHYAKLRRAHRDQRRERGEIPTPKTDRRHRQAEDWKAPALAPDQVLLYGLHTVKAAISNRARKHVRLRVTKNALARLELDSSEVLACPIEIVQPSDIDKLLGPDAIHQGVVLETKPFAQTATLIPAAELHQSIADSGKAVIHIHFATDNADILPESLPQISAVIQLLEQDTTLKLSVNGYTDNTGETMHNLVLSQQRAASVVKALESGGIDHPRLKARGFGEQRPAADNDTEAGRAANRRVELVRL